MLRRLVMVMGMSLAGFEGVAYYNSVTAVHQRYRVSCYIVKQSLRC